MKKIKEAKKWFKKLYSSCNLFSEIWFSVVKTVEETNIDEVDYCGNVNKSHKGFIPDTFEKTTKYRLGGYYLVMESTTAVPGYIPLMDIGYKQTSFKVL